MFEIIRQHKIIRAELKEDGSLEVIRQYPSSMCYASGKPMPDEVVKEIYRCEAGKIVCAEILRGKHTPAYVVEERIDFEN